jgi:hypothetical protein
VLQGGYSHKMFGWVKKAAKGVVDVVRGVVSTATQIGKAGFHRTLGVIDFVGTLVGWMPEKKISIEVLILQKNHTAIADISDVQAVLDLANDVYREQMNVRVENRHGGRPVELEDEVPDTNLHVSCAALKVVGNTFTSEGSWFRDHQVTTTGGVLFGYGSPVTVFIVEDVKGGDAGCCPGLLSDYAVLDPSALGGSQANRLLLAHEVGHACGLPHPWLGLLGKKKNLMYHESDRRSRRLSRVQKAWFRSSGHVTRTRTGTITDG